MAGIHLSQGENINFVEYLGLHPSSEDRLKRWIRDVYEEDVGEAGDVTSMATIPADAQTTARFLVKKDGILAGVQACQWIAAQFALLSHQQGPVALQFDAADGQRVQCGQHVGSMAGSARAILQLERTLLNVMQRMSGIATQTNRMVTIAREAARETGAPAPAILDTRKTAPGMRLLDKLAVKIGGGENHRFGLYDMVLIKDNHVAAAGGVTNAIQHCLAYLKQNNLEHLKIECEVETIAQVEELLVINLLRPTDRVMLDNMVVRTGIPDHPFDLERLKEALSLLKGRHEIEVSGNITEESIATIVTEAPGLDFLSSGALTHSVVALDISLNIDL